MIPEPVRSEIQAASTSPGTSTKRDNFLRAVILNFSVSSRQNALVCTLVPRYHFRPKGLHKVEPLFLTMATIAHSQVFALSSVESSCQTCQTTLDSQVGRENKLLEENHTPPVKIILVCLTCKATFDQHLGRNMRTYWTKKNIHIWTETVVHITAKPRSKYMVKFHRGTTLKLRHAGKVSTLRVPNRWTRII
jgi:hypothetical protein